MSVIPKSDSRRPISLSWYIVSKAALKSNNTSKVTCCSSIDIKINYLSIYLVPFARPHRLDRELQFSKLQDKASHLLSGGTHLAVNSCCGRLSDGTVLQALKLTLPNQQTCQKNCSHNDHCLCRDSWSLGLRRVVRGKLGEMGTSLFCTFIATLLTGLEGWLFGGLIFHGSPSMRRSSTFLSLYSRRCSAWDSVWHCLPGLVVACLE